MARQLTLQRFGIETVELELLGAVSMRMTASDPGGSGADPNIFLFLRYPPDTDGTVWDVFQTICSPVDMYDYPVDGPSGRTPYPFFRASSVDLLLRSPLLAEASWKLVIQYAQALLEGLNRWDKLQLLEEAHLGDAFNDSISIMD